MVDLTVTDLSLVDSRLITETLPYDGGRVVTAYMPSSPPTAIVYAGDGALIAPWGADLESRGLPSTMIIGAHRAADETARLHEYVFGEPSADIAFDHRRFEAHEQFFVHELRDWARSRFGVALPVERTAVFGVSAGGELALAMGLRHPEIYGSVFCASPGAGYRPPQPFQSRLPRTYLVAGKGEPFFLQNAVRWRDALQVAGAEVAMAERDGGHGDAFWRDELPLMVDWAWGETLARS